VSLSVDRTFAFMSSLRRVLAPPPAVSVSEWADANRVLVRESSAEPGSWRTSKTPYLRAIQDAISDKRTRKIVLKLASQLGKTEAILNGIGYFADLDPGPTMYVLPNEKLAKSYSTARLQPMITATPALRSKFSDQRSRDGSNNKLEKSFPGGFVIMASAESPAELAGRPIRVLLMDEIDRMNNSREGDPVELALKRTTTFWNKKIILVSSPTVDGQSRVENEYQEGTMESWFVPCPACGHEQVLSYWRLTNHADPRHRCEECGSDDHDQADWLAASRDGRWIPTRTHDQHGAELTTRSFHLSCLPSPWWSWVELRNEHDAAKRLMERHQDASKMVTFKNTRLAELWTDSQGERLDWEELRDRREVYDLPEGAEIPEPVLLLTAGIDTQDNRLEYTVYGFGLGRESWAIEHGILPGNTASEQVWSDLTKAVYDREFVHASGRRMKIARMFIDSGGHRATEVQRWCKNKSPRAYPIRGQAGRGLPIIKNRNMNNELRVPQVILGVDSVKSELITRLKVETTGPAYYHFPKNADNNDARGFTEEFFVQLTSERCSFRYVLGVPKQEWILETGKRNESWDCAVYAFAALEDYSGFSKPNDLLERVHRDLSDTEPKQPHQYGVYDPSKNPTPRSISPTSTPQQVPENTPRWRTNGRTGPREFDPRVL
jgi:phage terminase large subunit GpA-like protein